MYLHLGYPVWWVLGSRRQPFPVTVQNINLILSFGAGARSRTRLQSPGTQTQQHEDKGRRNGPTFRHFKWLPTGRLRSYVANSLNWHVNSYKITIKLLLRLDISQTNTYIRFKVPLFQAVFIRHAWGIAADFSPFFPVPGIPSAPIWTPSRSC